MAQLLFKNNAFSSLGAGLLIGGTTLIVASGHGDRFPVVSGTDFMMLTLQDASNNIEIVKVTARASASDSMTIERAQEGTSARAWSLGDVVELRLTSFALNPLSLLAGVSAAADFRAKIGAVTFTSATGSLTLPSGTTAQRDDPPSPGMLRYNSETSVFEGYKGAAWKDLSVPEDASIPRAKLERTALADSVSVISANTTATAFKTYEFSASLELLLPATPTAGDWVGWIDRSDTTTCKLGYNDKDIEGDAADYELDVKGSSGRATYTGVKWRVVFF